MARSIRKQHSRSFQKRRLSAVPPAGAVPIRDEKETLGRSIGRAGCLLRGMFQFPYTFVVMNWAAVVGFYAFLQNKKDIWVRASDGETWEGVVDPIAAPVQQTESARKAA